MSRLKDDLQSSQAFPTPIPSPVDFIETHISWVFLGEHDVFKVKKPVNFGFLDYSTLELRKRACEAEVTLNARLAPGIYLGIVPITKSPSGTHSIGGHGEILDWAVHMRRLPDSRRADILLNKNRLGFKEIALLAERLAHFHTEAKCSPEINHFGEPESVEINVRENFDQTRDFILEYLSTNEAEELEVRQFSFLKQNKSLLQKRIRDGHIRDGHGDLRLQQIYLDPNGNTTILDCIEFNDRFRYGDVASDLAFLSMDLAYHGRVDLAEYLLARYAREANDFDLFSVIDFYESYRAHVRAKVAGFLVLNPEFSDTLRIQSKKEARRYFLLALALCRRTALGPAVIAVGGSLATGKSTIADWIGEHLSAPVIDTDRTRKYLLGVSPTQFVGGSEWKGAYSMDFTEKVYDELFRRAKVILDSGRSVVLDATFRSTDLRKRAKDLALFYKVPFRFIECTAPTSVCRERLLKRESQKIIVSDARVKLLDTFSDRFEAIQELDFPEHITLDTSQSFDDTARSLSEFVALWPPRFVA